MDGLLGMKKDWLAKIESRGFECYNIIRDIIFEQGEYIAICNSGNVFKSSDAIAWSKILSSTKFRGINYCKDKFIATGLSGELYIGNNPTGMSKTPSSTGADLYGASYGDKEDTYVAVGKSGTIITSKSNHTSWSPASSPTTNFLFSTAYGSTPMRYVAVGEKDTGLWSDDAITWRQVSIPVKGETLLGVTFNNNKFVAVGTNGCCAESSDGKTWIPGSPWGDIKDISGRRDIRSIGSAFVGVGYNGRVISGSGTSFSMVVDPFEKKK